MNLYAIEKSITVLDDFIHRSNELLRYDDIGHLEAIREILVEIFKEQINSIKKYEILEPKELTGVNQND